MERKEDEPFAREPWQRLLREGDNAPSEATDLRIHAEARRALASRPVRWWVPATLAASFVLVVMIVQSQYAGFDRQPSVGESDVAARPAANVVMDLPAPAEAPAEAPAAPPATAPAEEGFSVSPPMVELPAPAAEPPPPAREEREDKALLRQQATAPPLQEAAKEETVESSRITVTGNLAAMKSSADETRTPEDWYAEIEALRTAGRVEEAEAELKKLETAHPGWLAKHHPPKP